MAKQDSKSPKNPKSADTTKDSPKVETPVNETPEPVVDTPSAGKFDMNAGRADEKPVDRINREREEEKTRLAQEKETATSDQITDGNDSTFPPAPVDTSDVNFDEANTSTTGGAETSAETDSTEKQEPVVVVPQTELEVAVTNIAAIIDQHKDRVPVLSREDIEKVADSVEIIGGTAWDENPENKEEAALIIMSHKAARIFKNGSKEELADKLHEPGMAFRIPDNGYLNVGIDFRNPVVTEVTVEEPVPPVAEVTPE